MVRFVMALLMVGLLSVPAQAGLFSGRLRRAACSNCNSAVQKSASIQKSASVQKSATQKSAATQKGVRERRVIRIRLFRRW
jgi:hypothetical protein